MNNSVGGGGFPSVGQVVQRKKKITSSDIDAFVDISMDANPLHLDDDYASQLGFKSRIAHGFISLSIFSGIFGTELPGKGSLYIEQNVRFLKPVYINEEILAVATVVKVSERSGVVVFTTECFGLYNKEKKVTGMAKILVAGSRK